MRFKAVNLKEDTEYRLSYLKTCSSATWECLKSSKNDFGKIQILTDLIAILHEEKILIEVLIKIIEAEK